MCSGIVSCIEMWMTNLYCCLDFYSTTRFALTIIRNLPSKLLIRQSTIAKWEKKVKYWTWQEFLTLQGCKHKIFFLNEESIICNTYYVYFLYSLKMYYHSLEPILFQYSTEKNRVLIKSRKRTISCVQYLVPYTSMIKRYCTHHASYVTLWQCTFPTQ